MEALFDPQSSDDGVSMERVGLAQLLLNTIEKVDPGHDWDTKASMLHSLVLGGGTTLLKGFEGRLRHDLAQLLPAKVVPSIDITVPGNRLWAAWCGGSIVSDFSQTTAEAWMTGDDYAEVGVRGIHGIFVG